MAQTGLKGKSAGQLDHMRSDRLGEALELALPGVDELVSLADAQVGNDVGDEDLAGLGLAQSRAASWRLSRQIV